MHVPMHTNATRSMVHSAAPARSTHGRFDLKKTRSSTIGVYRMVFNLVCTCVIVFLLLAERDAGWYRVFALIEFRLATESIQFNLFVNLIFIDILLKEKVLQSR